MSTSGPPAEQQNQAQFQHGSSLSEFIERY
jgi:hypothetical protein